MARSRLTHDPGASSPSEVTRRVDASRSNEVRAGREIRDGEAAAVDGDGVTKVEFGGEGEIEGEARLLAFGFQRNNGADGFNESCEHGSVGGGVDFDGGHGVSRLCFMFRSGAVRKQDETEIGDDRGDQGTEQRPSGEMPSLKNLERMLWPAGLGALAMTVRPPPVTAPATTACFALSEMSCTCAAR